MKDNKLKLTSRLNLDKLPTNIGIIMDGNGRWATRRGLPRSAGHRAGISTMRKIVAFASDLGIKYVTVFACSTENLKRPKNEVDAFFELMREYLNEDTKQFTDKGIRVCFIGDYETLPKDLVDGANRGVEATKHCIGMTLVLAVNYGGRDDIVRAVNKAVKAGKQVTQESFANLLYTTNIPDPDLVIRTSGELRISNFLLYQMAYAELFFTKTLWPSFSTKEFQTAICAFQRRTRRFGKLKS